MFERFSRSWELVKASASVLSQDKELLVFPAVSAVATFIVGACFVLPMIGMGGFDNLGRAAEGEASIGVYLWAFAFYLAQYSVIFFFNAALVGAAMIRLEGGDPTVADGFRIAFGKIGPILGYAAIAATVGIILRAIQERVGFIGRWVTGLLGVAWTVATFMVVPILVTRNVGPLDAVKESASMLRRTWGENVIGQGGLGLVFGLIQVLLVIAGIAVFIGAASTQSVALMTIAALGVIASVILVALVQTALSGIYAAALYRHASGQQSVSGFDPQLLQNAFAHK
jgi:hypothetical protein